MASRPRQWGLFVISNLLKLTISEVAAILGIGVGCAFASYALISTGYFSIVGPGMLGWFLETNLLSGAIFCLPYVLLALTITPFFVFESIGRSIFGEKRNQEIPTQSTNLIRNNSLSMALVGALLFVSNFIYSDYSYNDTYYSTFIWAIATLYSLIMIRYNVRNRFYPFLVIYFVIMLMNLSMFLIVFGASQGHRDLVREDRRYDVVAEDKTYLNVTVIRTTSSSLILRVGKDVVFYERSRIKRLSRTPDDAVQKD